MGLLNMSPLDLIVKVMDFSQKSLENTTGTIKEVHLALTDIPIDIAQEFGLSREKATALKATHRRTLDHIERGFCTACVEFNQYIVKQAMAVDEYAEFKSKPARRGVVMLGHMQNRLQDKKAG